MIALTMVFASFCISLGAGLAAGAVEDGSRWMTCTYVERGAQTKIERCGE